LKELLIRKAQYKDQEALLNLEQKLIDAERPYNPTLKAQAAIYYDFDTLLDESTSHLMVVESGNEIIGTGYAQIRSSKKSLNHDTHAYLGFMYVEAEYRGFGINKMIMENLMQWSKEQGVSDFYLDVYDDNEAAIRAYEKVGFSKSLVEMKINLRSNDG